MPPKEPQTTILLCPGITRGLTLAYTTFCSYTYQPRVCAAIGRVRVRKEVIPDQQITRVARWCDDLVARAVFEKSPFAYSPSRGMMDLSLACLCKWPVFTRKIYKRKGRHLTKSGWSSSVEVLSGRESGLLCAHSAATLWKPGCTLEPHAALVRQSINR